MEGIAALNKTVVGQILEIHEEEWFQIITLETPLGDIVYLKYEQDAIGATPQVGGVYAISYLVEGGTLRVIEVNKPAPGQYRAEFEKSADYRKDSSYQSSSPYTRSYTTTTTSPPVSRYERKYPPPRRDIFTPTTSVTEGVRPNGITIITILLLLLGSIAFPFGLILTGFPYTSFFGMVSTFFGFIFLLLSWGIYTYREWARTGMLIIGVILCISVVGLIPGAVIIWYLDQKEIRSMYVY